MKMTKVLFLVSMIYLVGCGGGSSDSKDTKINNETESINENHSLNDYGYYGSNVIFGSRKIQGEWFVYGVNSDGTFHYIPQKMKFDNDEFLTPGTGLYSYRAWSPLGTYGVSKNGKILKIYYTVLNSFISYAYIEDIVVKSKSTNVEHTCMKVISSYKEYQVFCKQ